MRTYFCFLIPRTDVSARLYMRCALLLLISSILYLPSLCAQKCPGGLDSIQQVSVTIGCDSSILIAWEAHPDKCYNFSIPGASFVQTNVSSGMISLSGSGVGINTGSTFYVNESCSSTPSSDPCQSHSGSSTSVDIYEGALPNLNSLGTWHFRSSGSSSNTKDVGTVFTISSPTDIPNIVTLSKINAETTGIIRPSGSGTSDAQYCLKFNFDAGVLDSIELIGDNVTPPRTSGELPNGTSEYSFCITNVSAGTYTNGIIAYQGKCVDTLNNIQSIILPGSDVPTLACNGYLQISLTGSGAAITPAMMLPGQPTTNRISFIEGSSSNIVDCSHAGQNVNVVVLDTIHNQKCWGVVAVRDKSVATASARDTSISCLANMDSLTADKLLSIQSNCDDLSRFEISFSDLKSPGDCNSGDTLKLIERTWIIRSPSGQLINAVSNIVIENVPFDTIIFPGDTTIYCPDTSFAISNTGGINIDLDSLVTYCKFQVGFSDREIPTGCSGMKKIERSWLAIDWCNNIMKDTIQFITLLDTLPPVLNCPAGDANGISKILTTLDTCGAYFTIPTVSATDACSTDSLITYDIRIGGVLIQNQDSVFMSVGENIVEYIARDDCGNTTSCMDTITVKDDTPPTLNGPSIIQVTHNGTGNTQIPIFLFAQAFDIDDNCALDSVFIRRITSQCGLPSDTIFGQSISICCADSDSLIEVELMAKDTSELTNTLRVMIDVKDGTSPTVSCSDTIVYLNAAGEFILSDNSLFVNSVSDNCGFDVAIDLSRDTLFRADTNAIVQLIVTASDIDGSSASCTSMVTVRDTFSNSGNNLLVGRVSDPFDQGLGGIGVTLLQSEREASNLMTDANGLFKIPQDEESEELSIKINGYGTDMSGVSSLDLFLIQKHILGLQNLDNNYLELAADVDQSGEVSVRDLISLQNAILDLPNSASLPWLFLEQNQVANELVYTSNEVIPIERTDIEFKAVKLGDVNGDIYTNASGRDNIITDLLIEERILKGKVEHTLPIYILPENGVVSFHLVFDINDNEKVVFEASTRFGKEISIQWIQNGSSLQIIGYGEFENDNRIQLGWLVITPSTEKDTREIFDINSESEIYSKEFEKQSLDLAWYKRDKIVLSAKDGIMEVYPNPAVDRVNFKIDVESNDIKKFSIMDITGKQILDLSDTNNKKFSLPTSVFPSSGSYIVNIETSEGVQNDILLINKK